MDEYLERCFCTAILDLHLSKAEFLDLTPYDFSCLVLRNEEKLKDEYRVLRNTIYNSGINLMRKKGDKEVPLFDESNETEDNEEKLRKEREALFSEITG